MDNWPTNITSLEVISKFGDLNMDYLIYHTKENPLIKDLIIKKCKVDIKILTDKLTVSNIKSLESINDNVSISILLKNSPWNPSIFNFNKANLSIKLLNSKCDHEFIIGDSKMIHHKELIVSNCSTTNMNDVNTSLFYKNIFDEYFSLGVKLF